MYQLQKPYVLSTNFLVNILEICTVITFSHKFNHWLNDKPIWAENISCSNGEMTFRSIKFICHYSTYTNNSLLIFSFEFHPVTPVRLFTNVPIKSLIVSIWVPNFFLLLHSSYLFNKNLANAVLLHVLSDNRNVLFKFYEGISSPPLPTSLLKRLFCHSRLLLSGFKE